jgi:hypothetical protein
MGPNCIALQEGEFGLRNHSTILMDNKLSEDEIMCFNVHTKWFGFLEETKTIKAGLITGTIQWKAPTMILAVVITL